MAPRSNTIRKVVNRGESNKEVRLSHKRSMPEKIGTKRPLQEEVNDYLLRLVASALDTERERERIPASTRAVRSLELIQVPKKTVAKQNLQEKLIHGNGLEEMQEFVNTEANPKRKQAIAHITGITVVRKRLIMLLAEGDIITNERQAQAEYMADELGIASAAKVKEADQFGIVIARSNHNMNPNETLTAMDAITGALDKGIGPSPDIQLADWRVYPNLAYWQK